MPKFILLAPQIENHGEVESLVQEKFPDSYFKLGPGMWAISAPGISKQIGDKLFGEGPYSPLTPQFVVFPLPVGYFGFTFNSLWEWLASKEKDDGAS